MGRELENEGALRVLARKIGRFSEDNVTTGARRSKTLIDQGQNRIQHKKSHSILFARFRILI